MSSSGWPDGGLRALAALPAGTDRYDARPDPARASATVEATVWPGPRGLTALLRAKSGDDVGARTWRRIAAAASLLQALPSGNRPVGGADLARLAEAGRLLSQVRAALPPPPADPVLTASSRQPFDLPDRVVMDTILGRLRDEMTDVRWTDPLALAGLIEDLVLAVADYRRLARVEHRTRPAARAAQPRLAAVRGGPTSRPAHPCPARFLEPVVRGNRCRPTEGGTTA